MLLLLVMMAGCAAVRGERSAGPVAFDCQTFHTGSSPFAVAIGDWNNDGKPDLAVSEAGADMLTLFMNQGKGKYTPAGGLKGGHIPRGIAVADINADGNLDIALANAESHNVIVFVGDGKGGFTRNAAYRTGVAPFHPALADLDGDGRIDLVIVNESDTPYTKPGTVSVHYGQGDGSFAEPLILKADENPSAAAIADFDGQHGLDLAVTNWGSDNVSIFLNTGDRNFRKLDEVPIGGGPAYAVATADFDRDGHADLAVADIAGHAVRVLYGDGTGHFPRTAGFAAGEGIRDVRTVDLNGDGLMDLITANTAAGTISILFGQADGSFAPTITIPTGRGARTVVAADLNGDTLIDLAVTDEFVDSVALLFQTRGSGTPCPVSAPPANP